MRKIIKPTPQKSSKPKVPVKARLANKPKVQVKIVTEASDQQRVDNFLLKTLKGVPKSHIYRMLRTGQVRVNSGRAKPEHKLSVGDKVRIPPVQTASSQAPIKPSAKAIDTIKNAIIFEHDDFLILNKPSGFAVHGGSGVNYGVIDVLRAMEKGAFFELVHRLDKETSGCLLIAKNRLSLTLLQNEWREDRVSKTYLAITKGHWRPTKQVITEKLRKNELKSGESLVVVDAKSGRAAKTEIVELERYDETALIKVILHTGRMHQIRVHCAHVGHPILGDDKYGDKTLNKHLKAPRLCLHAHCLQFQYQSDSISVEAEWI